MTYIDIILIIIFLMAFTIGWRLRGIYTITIPIAFFIGLFFANAGYTTMSEILSKTIINETKRMLISYTILFLIASSIVIIIAYTFAKFFDFFKLTIFDRILGAIIFICFISIPIYFIIFTMVKLNFNYFNFINAVKNSFIFPHLEKLTLFIIHLPVLKHFSIIKTIIK